MTRKRPKVGTEGDSPAFYEAVGRAVRAWANLENSLWLLAATLLGVDQFRARIIMKSLPTGGRAQSDLIVNLAETYLDPSLLPKCRSLMQGVNDQRLKRNMLAHAGMFVGGHNDMLIFKDVFPDNKVGGLTFKAEPFSLNEIKMLIRAIEGLTGEFVSFVIECTGKVHASPRTNREQPSGPTPTDAPPHPTTGEGPGHPPQSSGE